MYLHLDPTFTPWSTPTNTLAYKSFTFSGGEPHIIITDTRIKNTAVTITHRIQSFNDLGLVLLAVDALKHLGVSNICLFIPYFPGARQDRVIQKGEPLSVKVYADIINALQCQSVRIIDPHSKVTTNALHHCKAENNHGFIKEVLKQLNTKVTLVSPDAGAREKTQDLAAYLGDNHVINCNKVRDIQTGNIIDFSADTPDLQGKNCLIVDDICDGGRTFIALAKALQEKNAGDLFLAVTHGIFSRGTTELTRYYKQIFTTNSFKIDLKNQITSIPISNFLKQ